MQQYLLVLVRHGETEANVKGIIQGHEDSPLTLNGVHGAEVLAEWLSPVGFSHVVTSDLGRAVRTSEIIMSRNHHTKANQSTYTIVRDPQIRERCFGPHWPGRSFRDLYAEATNHGATYPNYAPEGVETLAQLRARCFDFVAKFSQTICKSSMPFPPNLSTEARARLHIGTAFDVSKLKAIVLMVAHGGIIREFFVEISSRKLVAGGLPPAAQKLCGNCCFSSIVVTVDENNKDALEAVKDVHIIAANCKPPVKLPVVKLPVKK